MHRPKGYASALCAPDGFSFMNSPTSKKRVYAFFDGQNIYRLALEIWGEKYNWPNYNPRKLARHVTKLEPDRELVKLFFYTGVPREDQNKHWHTFWTNKLRHLEKHDVIVFRGHINQAGKEKGTDVCLALDLYEYAWRKEYDVGIIFSQDMDFQYAVERVKKISEEINHPITLESAYPYDSQKSVFHHGIKGTRPRPIQEGIYSKFIDGSDYLKVGS